MVIFRVFTVLPDFDDTSDDVWRSRVPCDSLAVVKIALKMCVDGERRVAFPDDARRVLKELAGMDFDDDTRLAVAKDGVRCSLTDLPDDVCAALGVVVLAAIHFNDGQAFPLLRELESPRALCALHSLPRKFRFAVTSEAHDRITKAVDDAVAAQVKAAKKKADRESAFFRAMERYNFVTQFNGAAENPCPAAPVPLGFGPDPFAEPARMHRVLTECCGKLPALLHTVPEVTLSEEGGIPITGRLLFDPDTLLPPHAALHRAARFALFTITRRGGETATVSHADVTRGGLLAVCRYAHHLTDTQAGGISVSLVTDGRSCADSVLFCITVTPDGIHVSDHRAALEDFAAAVEKYLM